jgi:hypothetical protein
MCGLTLAPGEAPRRPGISINRIIITLVNFISICAQARLREGLAVILYFLYFFLIFFIFLYSRQARLRKGQADILKSQCRAFNLYTS